MSDEISGTAMVSWALDEERFLELWERRKVRAEQKLEPVPSQMDYLREVLSLALPEASFRVYPEGEHDLPIKITFEPTEGGVDVYEGPIDLDNG